MVVAISCDIAVDIHKVRITNYNGFFFFWKINYNGLAIVALYFSTRISLLDALLSASDGFRVSFILSYCNDEFYWTHATSGWRPGRIDCEACSFLGPSFYFEPHIYFHLIVSSRR